MNAKPAEEHVFIARWRDRLALAVADDARAANFARYMHSIADRIEVVLLERYMSGGAPNATGGARR